MADRLPERLLEWSTNCLIDGLRMDKGEPTLQELLHDAATRLVVETEGYCEAFYQIAKLLGLPAMPISPKEAYEQHMLPRLRQLIGACTSSNERVSDARLEHLIRIAEMDCRKTSILLKDGGYSEGNIPASQLRALTELRQRRADETTAHRCLAEGCADTASPFCVAHRNWPAKTPRAIEQELARYKQALTRANGFLIMHNLEPVKLEYSPEEPEPPHTGIVHAGGPHTIHEGSRADCAICSSQKQAWDCACNKPECPYCGPRLAVKACEPCKHEWINAISSGKRVCKWCNRIEPK